MPYLFPDRRPVVHFLPLSLPPLSSLPPPLLSPSHHPAPLCFTSSDHPHPTAGERTTTPPLQSTTVGILLRPTASLHNPVIPYYNNPMHPFCCFHSLLRRRSPPRSTPLSHRHSDFRRSTIKAPKRCHAPIRLRLLSGLWLLEFVGLSWEFCLVVCVQCYRKGMLLDGHTHRRGRIINACMHLTSLENKLDAHNNVLIWH